MTKLELLQTRLPHFFKKYEFKSENEKSVMYAILKALADMSEKTEGTVDRLNAEIGIDSTYNEDLQVRWGNLLGINRSTESYDLYRSELKLAIPSLIGGTRDAIKYAMAVVIGIEKDSKLQTDYIDVVDGWEYIGDVPDEYRTYGCFVCVVDMSVGDTAIDVEQQMIDSINKVKASGTAFYIVYKAFKVDRYYKLDKFNYDTLTYINYDNLGGSEE